MIKAAQNGAGRLSQLDALRGLAAFSVFLWHYSLLFDTGSQYPALHKLWSVLTLTPLYGLFAGHQAVLIFFVLSGIALTYMLRSIPTYWVYLYRRVTRLYLPYLVAVALVLAARTLFYDYPITQFSHWFSTFWAQPVTSSVILDHIIFIKAFADNEYDYVLWSLVYEMRLSIVFPFVLLLMARFNWKQNMVLFLALSLMGGLGYMLTIHHRPALANYVLTFHYLLMFAIGALMARFYIQIGQWYGGLERRQKLGLLAVGVFSYTYGVLPDRLGIGNAVINDWLTLPGAMIIIVIALYSTSVRGILLARIPQFLGRISYSLYLIHPIVQLGTMYALRNVLPLPVAALLAFLITLPLAALMYRLVELPSMMLGRRVKVIRPASQPEPV